MKAILERRSIRKYTKQRVSDDAVDLLLEYAMSAPSAGNERPWHFIVIRDASILNAIMKIHPHSHMLREASVAILVCGDLSKEVYKGFWVQDCAAATQNILVGVSHKGLGAVWLGIYPMESRVEGVKELFRLPENIVPFSLIPIGHPAEGRPKEERFDPSRVHRDRW